MSLVETLALGEACVSVDKWWLLTVLWLWQRAMNVSVSRCQPDLMAHG